MMSLDIPELARIEQKLDQLMEITQHNTQAWYNLKEAWAAKGGCAYQTMRSKRWLQPKGGIPEAYVGGKGVWSLETISEWLCVTDDHLADYHKKHLTGARPGREHAA